MSACGQTTAGSESQQSKPPDCIRVELYLLIVVCLCVNSVASIAGTEVDPGETDTLPRDKTLRFKSTFDGELVISINSCVVDKRKLSADKYMT